MDDSNNKPRLKKGLFIVFEGIDGAGKTVQSSGLIKRLKQIGLKVDYIKEPTEGVWGMKIRNIAEHGRDGVSAEQELEWFIKDREDDVRLNINPALRDCRIVIADRYFYSTIAYQSVLGLDPEYIRRLNDPFPVPDIVFMLEISPEMSQVRITDHRNEQANLGYEQLDYLRRVKKVFDSLDDPNIVRLDGTRDKKDVAGEIWSKVSEKLDDLYI